MIYDAKVIANEQIGAGIWIIRLTTETDLSDFRAGTFFHIQVARSPYPLFRRAYSIMSASANEAEILYKVAGLGTQVLSTRRPGDVISAMGPLGNAFISPHSTEHAVLLAGGVGMPPILRWAQNLSTDGFPSDHITFVYGARNASELVLRDRITSLGVDTRFATDDGSFGYKGFGVDMLQQICHENDRHDRKTRYYACGPGAMLAACTGFTLRQGVPGEIALETPMPCASGVCLGCVVACKRPSGDGIEYRRTCIDGPIFNAQEVVWPST